MAKKIALGKGIASLIQNTHSEIITNTLREEFPEQMEKTVSESGAVLLEIGDIKINPQQPRKIFKEKELDELSRSIKENGIIQPLIVCKTDDGFELIAGERRLRAAKKADIEKVPVIIKRVTDRERMVMAIIENVQRSDLNCVEEALAYYQLMDDFQLTQEELAKQIGKDRSSIANFLRILKLPRTVIELLQREILSFGHAKVLASVRDAETATRYANISVEKHLSVRELENLVKTKKNHPVKEKNRFFNEKLDQLKDVLEKNTGFHFAIRDKTNGAGEILIKYTNEAEFNDIFDYLLRK